jgi:ABC-type uncharacterized transport system auxiliary subunit
LKAGAFDYQIMIDILRFELVADSQIVLSAHWQLLKGKNHDVVAANRFNHVREVQRRDHTAIVAAMSEAVGRLSQQIGQVVLDMLAGGEALAGQGTACSTAASNC